MARRFFYSIVAVLILALVQFGMDGVVGQQGCGGECEEGEDCKGQLTCIEGRCGDDPEVGTKICSRDVINSRKAKGGDQKERRPSRGGAGECSAASFLEGRSHSCNTDNAAQCCSSNQKYPQFHCSPPVSSATPALLTLNSFASGGDGGSPSECDGRFHPDSEMVVALSTGWYAGGERCNQKIRIFGKDGRSTVARVVDECDSVNGCDAAHAFQPPCSNRVVDASEAVWNALGVSRDDPRFGEMDITWTDA